MTSGFYTVKTLQSTTVERTETTRDEGEGGGWASHCPASNGVRRDGTIPSAKLRNEATMDDGSTFKDDATTVVW